MKSHFIMFTISAHCFFVENNFSEALSDWEEIIEKAYSSNSEEREEAVSKLILAKDRDSISLLRNRLLIEINRDIIEKIFAFFEDRRSKSDFFHLVKFLEIVRDPSLSLRCMKLLYQLHPKRLRSDLNKMFVSNELKIHTLSFLKVVTEPTKEDRLWFYEQFRKHRVAKYWLGLHPRFDDEIFLALEPYYKKNLFTERLSNYTLYWYVLYKHHHKAKISEEIISRSGLEIIESIPERRQAPLLKALEKYIPMRIKFKEWMATSSYQIKFWLLRTYFRTKGKTRKNSAPLPGAWDIDFSEFLSRSEDLPLLKIATFYLSLWSGKERSVFKERCQRTGILQEICFRFWLHISPETAVNKWKTMSSLIKQKLSALYFRDMISLKEFHGLDTIKWFLSNKKTYLQYKLLRNLPTGVVIQNSDLFISFFKSRSNYRARLIFLSRIMKHPKLKKVFLKHLPDLQYSL